MVLNSRKKSVVMAAIPVLLGTSMGTTALRAESPDDDAGRVAFEDHCKMCHALETATNERHTEGEWKEIIGRMINNGAELSDTDQAIIIAYLARNYSPPSGMKPGNAHVSQP